MHVYESRLAAALCGFGEENQTQNFDIYNIKEVMMQSQRYFFFRNWIKKLFSEEDEQGLKLQSWQGPPHTDKVEQYEMMSFFIMFV